MALPPATIRTPQCLRRRSPWPRREPDTSGVLALIWSTVLGPSDRGSLVDDFAGGKTMFIPPLQVFSLSLCCNVLH
jgi:hypothetical protein